MTQPAPAADPALSEAIRCQRDLYLYWRLIAQAGGAPLTTQGYMARPAWRRLREQFERLPTQGKQAYSSLLPAETIPADLDERDNPRLLFLRRLLERLRLLHVSAEPQEAASGQRLLAAEPAVMARYLRLSLAGRLQVCARVWATGAWWPDIPTTRQSPAQTAIKAPAPQRALALRRQALATLAEHEPGETVSPASYAEAAPKGRARIPTRPRSHLSNMRGLRKQAHTLGEKNRAVDEGAMFNAAYNGPLRWLGFVASDNTTDPPTLLVSAASLALRKDYRPTHNGAIQTESAHDEIDLPEETGRIIALADLTIIAYPPLTAPALFMLDTCAAPLALDQTARYRLTREALSAARTHGWSATEVVTRLESLTGASLPANVRVTLADWERQGNRLRLTPDVTLLEARDPAVLDALLTDATAHAWVARRLAPTLALLTAEGAPLVRGWLLRNGQLPAVVRAPEPGAGETEQKRYDNAPE